MKNTNQLFFALLAAAALVFAAGCSDGSEESGSSSAPSEIVGTWIYGNSSNGAKFLFSSDYSFTWISVKGGNEDSRIEGTWSWDGLTISISYITDVTAGGGYTEHSTSITYFSSYSFIYGGNTYTKQA